jgi:hypothetical protein
MDSTPLAARSPNTHLALSHEQEKNAASKMTSMDYHRQILQGKLDNQDKCGFSCFAIPSWDWIEVGANTL